MTISTDERVDLVKLVAALLHELDHQLGTGNEFSYFMPNPRQKNCGLVRRKLFELLDESGERK